MVDYIAVLLMSMSLSAFCQEFDISGALNAEGSVYKTKFGDNEATQTEAIVIRPSILGSYSSRGLSASIAASHSRIKRSVDTAGVNDNTSQNFTNLRYTSDFTLIKNSLFLKLNGAQNYRAVNQQQADFSDEILASEDLTRYKNNSAQLNFSIPNPIYLGFTLQSTYSKTQTDKSQAGQTGVDGDNLGVSARLFQGKNIRPISFDISVQYNDTSRANFQNFESTRLRGDFGIPIIKEVEFIVTGNMEKNDSGQVQFTNRPNLDSSSYGAGLRWIPNNGRNLSLTYNQLDNDGNKTDFLGVNINWAFSSRTGLDFDYGKRFYGDAYTFNFRHSLKSIRTSVSYSENVTTFSRLNASSNDINGIFVCEFGSTELTDCFQPGSLDYQLQVGQEFRASTEIDTDISEEVLFRKSGTATIGYDKRKIKMSINAIYQRTEYLESNRLSTNRSLRFNFTYALGRRTNINFASAVSRNQFSELGEPDTTITNSINFKRNLGRYLNMNISARLLDRESDNLGRDASDKRLTVGLNYTF